MKKFIIIIIFLVYSSILFSQEKMVIHQTNGISLGVPLAETDSAYFNSDGSIIHFRIGGTDSPFWLYKLDSITFAENSDVIEIRYNGNMVYIYNPLAYEGVSVTANGAYVTITSTTEVKDITYRLTGISTNGMFKIYSEKRFNLELNGVELTNPEGPAINIQSQKKASVTLVAGSVNELTDGETYADPVITGEGEEEDQNGVFFSEGQLVFTGTGSLTINGNGEKKHGLCNDDLIEIDEGVITVTSAAKDGIHAKNGLLIAGGTLNITANGDGIDGDEGSILISGGIINTTTSSADVKGITCDSILAITGGTLTLTLTGDQSKGIKSLYNMALSGGMITINNYGSTVLEAVGSGYDPTYSSAIKCNKSLTIDGATITIHSTGKGGKGISTDKDVNILSGNINITCTGSGATYIDSSGTLNSYHSSCISSNGNVFIQDGSVTVLGSGAGGKGISTDGSLTIGDDIHIPVINVTTTGSKITITAGSFNQSGDYDEAKAITCNKAITINNGSVTISSADDGIKSDVSVEISNATVSITKSVEGIESPDITVNSGNVKIVASDDSFNATKGNGGEANDGSNLNLKGGYIMVNSSTGDGLDSNGNIMVTGGTIIVHGPQSQPEVGMDYNGTCNVSYGFLVISGINSNMTQSPSTSSTQYSVKVAVNTSLSSSTLFHIQDANGNDIVTFQPMRSYSSIIFSSSGLKNGSTYSIYTGGSSTGTNTNGLYSGGTYSGGTLRKTFSVSGIVTNVSF